MNSQDNKQLIMRGYQLFQAKDIQQLLTLFADDIEWIGAESEHIPFSHPYHGREQVAQFFADMDQAQEAIRFEPETFIAEDDKVVVTGQSAWLVKATGQRYESPWVHVFTVQNGKVTRLQQYNDTAAAEAAFRPSSAPRAQQGAPLHH